MKLKAYGNGCPLCKQIEHKVKNVDWASYESKTTAELLETGATTAPWIVVEGLPFDDAVKLLRG